MSAATRALRFTRATGALDRERRVGYDSGSMELNRKSARFGGNFRAVPCAVLAVVVFLLIAVPFLDLAWNEPVLDQGQGVWCQLHANPGAALEPAPLLVTPSAALLPSTHAVQHFPLLGCSIFVPPRV